MKKIVCVLLALLTLIPCLAFAGGPDYSSMTADELRAVIADARAALAALEEPFTDKCVVYDDNGIKVTITGAYVENGTGWLYLGMTVVNKSEFKIRVSMEDVYMNGWQVSSPMAYIGGVEAGKNAKKDVYFMSQAKDADVVKIEDLEDIAFKLAIKDDDSYKVLYTTDEQTITFSW